MTVRFPRISIVAGAGLLALFPAFFFYHTALGLFGMPSFLGGWFGPSLAIITPVLGLLQWRRYQTRRDSLSYLDVLFLVLCGFIVLWSTLHLFVGADYQRSWALWGQAMYSVVVWVACFVIFRHVDLGSRALRRMLVLSLGGMLAVAVVFQESGFFYAARLADSSEGIASYQGFARSAFVVGLMLLCIVRGRFAPIVWISGLLLLYLLGARSEFVSFVIVGTVIFSIISGSIRFGMVAAFIVIVALVVDLGALWNDYGNPRIASIADLEDDSSFLSRVRLHEVAWATIRSSPLVGDYGSHVRSGSIGSYSHDALSAWVAYGLVGFLLFVLLLAGSLGASIRQAIWGHAKNPVVLLALGMSMHVTLMAVAAKSIYWVLFGAGWGAAARALEQRKRGDRAVEVQQTCVRTTGALS